MAGVQELDVIRHWYVAKEPLDNKMLSDIVLSIDHEGGNIDVRKPVVDVPSRESSCPGVRAVRRELRNTKAMAHMLMETVGSAKR